MRRLIVDIETVPTDAALQQPYPEADQTPPANYKSDEAISRWREADRVKWQKERAKECSLSPRLGRIICIGTSDGNLLCFSPDEEAGALKTFWQLADNHDYYLATWNGAWDLQFIVLRSLALNVPIPASPWLIAQWFKRYSLSHHFDVKAALTNWAPPKAGEGLTEWAEFFGLAGKADGWTGASVWPAYQEGRYTEIAAYCTTDVLTTKAIYEKVAMIYDSVAYDEAMNAEDAP